MARSPSPRSRMWSRCTRHCFGSWKTSSGGWAISNPLSRDRLRSRVMDGIILTRLAPDGGGVVADIMLARPPVNALSTSLARALATTCAEIAAEPSVRAVVLSGAPGRAFCAGADLKERAAITDADIAGRP